MRNLLIAATLFTATAYAQVEVTCIPEPAPTRYVVALGCDAVNHGASAVAIPVGDFRKAALDHLIAPLRPSAADARVTRENKMGFWGWMVRIVKWGGFGWSVAQGFIPEDKLSDLERMTPGGVSGVIQLVDAFVGQNRETLRLPLDYMPEVINLPVGGADSYTLYALPQEAVRGFTVALATPTTTVSAQARPAPREAIQEFIPTHWFVYWLDTAPARRFDLNYSIAWDLEEQLAKLRGELTEEHVLAMVSDYLQVSQLESR